MSLVSMNVILVAPALLAVYTFLLLVVYPALFSTLSRVPPAHFLAPWTPLWILRKRLKKGENSCLYEAHSKLGEVIRLGPNEVSLNCLEGLKTVYVGNFDKHPWFANAGMVKGVPNAFSSLDSKSHADSRRLFTHIFSKTYIQTSEDIKLLFTDLITNRLTPVLCEAACQGQSIDIISLVGAIAYDFTTTFVFGPDSGTNMIGDVQFRDHLLKCHDEVRPYFTILGHLLKPINSLRSVGIQVVPSQVYKSFDEILQHVTQMYNEASHADSNAFVYDHTVRTFAKSRKIWAQDEKLISEFFDQVIAGFDAVSTVIIYTVYEMSQRPKLQFDLRQRLHRLGIHDHPYNPRELDAMPLLDAIIQETMRKYPPSPGPLPRVVPPGGLELCGYFLPAGTRISSNAYTLHRTEKVFPNPELWNPARWLSCSEQQLREMKKWFWAFGSGPRICLGIYFALQEIKYVLAAIYSKFETEIVEVGDMTQMDGALGRPVGNKLITRFRNVSETS